TCSRIVEDGRRQLQARIRPHRTNQRPEGRHGDSTTRYIPPSLRCARDDHPRKPEFPSIAETSSKGSRRDPTLEGTDILVRPVCEGNSNAVPSYGDRREHWLRRDALRRLDKCVVPLFQSIVDFGPGNEDRRASDVPGSRASVHVAAEASHVRLL